MVNNLANRVVEQKSSISGGSFRTNTKARRLELLKMEGMGFNRLEIVKELSQKHGISERAVYYDFEYRSRWQPLLQDNDNLVLKVLNRYEQIYRQASRKFLTASNENTQIGALNVMLKANEKTAEAVLYPQLLHDLEELEKEAKKKLMVE